MTRPRLIGSVAAVQSNAPTAELVVLGPSLGTTTALWHETAADLATDFRVLRFDLPGHGASPAAVDAFSIAELADAVLELVDSIGGGAFAYAGISLGGAIGIELALRAPDRVTNLTVICASAKIGSVPRWHERAAQVRASGTSSLVSSSAGRWYSSGFLDRHPAVGAPALARLVDVDDESYALCCDALAGFDARAEIGRLRVPALFVAAEFDTAVPPEQVQQLADAIPGAAYALITGAAHLPVTENPVEVTRLIRSQIGGMRVRRQILGDDHVDRATAAVTPESADFQRFITRYAWGEVWSRPGLERRDRSLLTLAALITGGHVQELAMHIRAAQRNGLDRAEIAEAIMHTAVYAGVPAANTAFAIAVQVFAEQDD